jgi:hypothetical protein
MASRGFMITYLMVSFTFFWNSHSSTITKQDDLGYAKVNEVAQEKSGNINGDTEYAKCELKINLGGSPCKAQ